MRCHICDASLTYVEVIDSFEDEGVDYYIEKFPETSVS